MLGISYSIEENSLLLSRREHRALTVTPTMVSTDQISEIISVLISAEISVSITDINYSPVRTNRRIEIHIINGRRVRTITNRYGIYLLVNDDDICKVWVVIAQTSNDCRIYVPISEAERASEIVNNFS
jgi:hypothetical protein